MRDEVKSIKAGPYTLVAKEHNGKPSGFLWRDAKVIDTVQSTSISGAWRAVCDALVRRLLEQADARDGRPYGSDEARLAFLAIAPRLTEGHKAMLREHLARPEHCITATQLATAAGYRGYSAANLQYGLLGAMLFAEMPESDLPTRADKTRIMTCAIASANDYRSSPEQQWVWKMRPHIAEGLRSSQILS